MIGKKVRRAIVAELLFLEAEQFVGEALEADGDIFFLRRMRDGETVQFAAVKAAVKETEMGRRLVFAGNETQLMMTIERGEILLVTALARSGLARRCQL